MQVKDSKFFDKLTHKEVNLSIGKFYFLRTFFVAELNEGVHFDWEKVTKVMAEVINYYGENAKLAYLSNRINSYSMNPHSWKKVHDVYGIIVASAIVSYNNFGLMNATLEKNFSEKSIKRCNNLEEAIAWIYNLREFN